MRNYDEQIDELLLIPDRYLPEEEVRLRDSIPKHLYRDLAKSSLAYYDELVSNGKFAEVYSSTSPVDLKGSGRRGSFDGENPLIAGVSTLAKILLNFVATKKALVKAHTVPQLVPSDEEASFINGD